MGSWGGGSEDSTALRQDCGGCRADGREAGRGKGGVSSFRDEMLEVDQVMNWQ